ncbi:hypothetical protein D9757_003651 [Collybiopsis confluens]|uniref:TERF2-interacting telomeric protein 1 Myb domain-containing protein n=1 Tax=Collybiopsis confluens TaxID=2823264 RepID=A0A8H5HUR3_9AGAR|nr:hypothetical protein D9757_003651 [Collybiopsis confluens]
MPSGRNSFTEEDETFLVEYLAGCKDRKGNLVYQRLEYNNTGQWPWSSRHPWQSWRHRYIRDSDYFDRRIRKYLGGKNRAASPDEINEKQASTSHASESKTSKRKRTVVENAGQQKRPKLENDIPEPMYGRKGSLPSTGWREGSGSASSSIDFVPISQYRQRALAALKGRGQGPGPSSVMQSQYKEAADGSKSPDTSSSGDLEEHSLRPSPHKQVKTLVTPPGLSIPSSQGKQRDDEKTSFNPPGSGYLDADDMDDRGRGSHEMESNPEPVEDEDSEVDHMLSDLISPAVDVDNDVGAYPPTPSPPIPPSSKLPSKTTRRNGKGKRVPSAIENIDHSDSSEEMSSDTDRPFPPPRPVPQLVEDPFGGTRHKQHSRRKIAYSSDSEAQPKEPLKSAWPPDRQVKQSAIALQPPATANSSPSSVIHGETNGRSSPRPTSTESPARILHTDKERTVTSDRSRRESPVVLSTTDQESLYTQPFQNGKGNADDEEEIDDESAEEGGQESPSRSSSPGPTTQSASLDDGGGHPVRTVPSPPNSKSFHTPRRLSPVHPFDKPGSHRSGGLDRSGGVARQLVSAETADSVIKALKTFLSEMNRNMNQQGLREVEGAEGSSMMLLSENSLRERGSPVRKADHSNSVDSLAKSQSPLVTRSNSRSNVDSPVIDEDEDDVNSLPAPSGTSSASHSGDTDVFSVPKKVDIDYAQRFQPGSVTTPSPKRNVDGADTVMSSISSVGDRSPLSAFQKGQKREVDTVDLDHGQTPNVSSHSNVVDLRKMARMQRRKSGQVSLSTSSSVVSGVTPASSRSSFSDSTQSPLKLSTSDQSRLIEQEIQNMVDQYGFPHEYVRTTWKRAGSLEKAAEVLAQLRDQAELLLPPPNKRRSPFSGTGVARQRGLLLSTPENSSSDSSNARARGRRSSHLSETTEVRRAVDSSRAHSTSRLSRSPTRRPMRLSSADRNPFNPLILDKPIPNAGYSPPTHSRAGQVALLHSQGRMEQALERERRRATWGFGVFSVYKTA